MLSTYLLVIPVPGLFTGDDGKGLFWPLFLLFYISIYIYFIFTTDFLFSFSDQDQDRGDGLAWPYTEENREEDDMQRAGVAVSKPN